MALHIYSLTQNIGKPLARSTSVPNNPEGRKNYRVIAWLDKCGSATPEGISTNTGLSLAEIGVVIRRLKFAHVIQEEGMTTI